MINGSKHYRVMLSSVVVPLWFPINCNQESLSNFLESCKQTKASSLETVPKSFLN